MVDISNGPFSALFSGSEPSSHTEVNGDPQMGPAIPCGRPWLQENSVR